MNKVIVFAVLLAIVCAVFATDPCILKCKGNVSCLAKCYANTDNYYGQNYLYAQPPPPPPVKGEDEQLYDQRIIDKQARLHVNKRGDNQFLNRADQQKAEDRRRKKARKN